MEGVTEDIRRAIAEAAAGTADPVRAERGLLRVVEALGGSLEPVAGNLRLLARLVEASQFLTNYIVRYPGELTRGLAEYRLPVEAGLLIDDAKAEAAPAESVETSVVMKRLRLFRMRWMLRLTLRYLSGESDVVASMEELSLLAEAVIEAALESALELCIRRYGEPPDRVSLAVIALGKLGGRELNYSSDVDLMFVYGGQGSEETSGTKGPTGVLSNKVSAHEFYCKAVEHAVVLVGKETEDGRCYRVDLRLRPQGQKGEIVLSLGSYREYYESWGRTWERMMLIRARVVAGDKTLGARFVEELTPFVWDRPVDYLEVQEIRALKKKIDSALLKDDIKRGYGGIREAEFFTQTFQLIYGGRSKALRTFRMLNALQGLRRMGLVPEAELGSLWDNYVHLRRIEHYLQMADDLQVYTLPRDAEAREALALRMGYPDALSFLADLRVRRMVVKDMYNSLLGSEEDVAGEALSLLEGGAGGGLAELEGYLAFKGLRNKAEAAERLIRLRQVLEGAMRSQAERGMLRRVLPEMVDRALRSPSPDRALAGLEDFASSYGLSGPYLAALREQKELLEGLVRVFSMSTLLTRILLGSPAYMNRLVEEMRIRKTLAMAKAEALRCLSSPDMAGEGVSERLAVYRTSEWLRLSIFFLGGIMPTMEYEAGLTHLAEAVLGAALGAEGSGSPEGFAVIGMGKLGGREINIGSDLDLLFLSTDPTRHATRAEALIKTLTEYTGRGALYEVDMRLRPEGSKGPLINDLEGYKRYYMNNAQGWELLALLRARPVGGDRALGERFLCMAREVLLARGRELRWEELAALRARIVREVSKEQQGLDIKLGPGGLEEMEFHAQWLALQHLPATTSLHVQNTRTLMRRETRLGLLPKGEALGAAYDYLRKLEALMKLNETKALPQDSDITRLAAAFLGHSNTEDLISHINNLRTIVIKSINGDKA